MKNLRVGIVGFGSLGQFLYGFLTQPGLEEAARNVEVVFVWNRSRSEALDALSPDLVLSNLEDFASRAPNMIVEVAHPSITQQFGARFLDFCDFFIGSPTALSDPGTEKELRDASRRSGHGLYVPAGALWGGPDIQKMADSGTLESLKVTMTKHPNSFKLTGHLFDKNQEAKTSEGPTVLFCGPVREFCPLAPNNVNTMAAAAICAHNLGFDGVHGCLRADPDLPDAHVVDIEVTGPRGFSVTTRRFNPARPGAVTGSATYRAFLASLLRAGNDGPGVHMC